MKKKELLLIIPTILALASCSANSSSTSSGVKIDDTSSDGEVIDDGIVRSYINTSEPTLGYYFAYDTLASVPTGTTELDINVHLGHVPDLGDTFRVGYPDLEKIKREDFDNYDFKVNATLINMEGESEDWVTLGELAIDPVEYFENDIYEVNYYDAVVEEEGTDHVSILFKNTLTFTIDLTKLKFDHGRWVVYFILIDFVAIDKKTNSIYQIPGCNKHLYHEYDETGENILFSTMRYDEELKPGSVTDNGWIVVG